MHPRQIRLPRSKIRSTGEGLGSAYSQSPLLAWGQSLGTEVVRRSSQRVFKSFVWFTCHSQQNALENIKLSCSWPFRSGLIHKTNCIRSLTRLEVILPYVYLLRAMCNRMDPTLKVRGAAERQKHLSDRDVQGCHRLDIRREMHERNINLTSLQLEIPFCRGGTQSHYGLVSHELLIFMECPPVPGEKQWKWSGWGWGVYVGGRLR